MRSHVALTALLLTTAAGCTAAPAERGDRGDPPAAATAAVVCVGQGGAIRAKPDSIGALPTLATFAELRTRCPGTRDTVVGDTADGFYGALLIPASGVTVLAVQGFPRVTVRRALTRNAIVPEESPLYWVLNGADTVMLPGGARGSARWADLVRRYGPALVVTAKSRVNAQFCALPGFGFVFDAPTSGVGNLVMLDSLSSRIPAGARVLEMTVIADSAGKSEPAGAECGGSGPYLEPGGAEKRVIATSSGRVRRVGDTLFIRTAAGAESTYVDNPVDNDTYVKFTYEGTVAVGALHKIDVRGWESGATLLVSAVTGGELRAVNDPVMSPDGKRFAAAALSMEVCEGETRLEIFRLTDTIPLLEWSVNPFDCGTDTGWGPSAPKWRSPDTLEFTRNELPPRESRRRGPSGITNYVTRPMLVVRADTTWRIVSPR
jgi:hypothetical protein